MPIPSGEVIASVRWSTKLPSRFRPTIPVNEYAADRVPVFFDRADLEYLAHHCCCDETTDQVTRERCGRVRFRCLAAAHKVDAPTTEVRPDGKCDFVAFMSLVPADRGGRQTGFSSGYRPQLFIDGDDCDVEILLDADGLNP
jgi:hypothetical protein